MNASRPTMQSSPSRAPVRICARCQMLVPGPTVTSGSRSAVAWTRAEGSITGRSEAPSGVVGTAASISLGRSRSAAAIGTPDPGPWLRSAIPAQPSSQDRRDDPETRTEGECAAPVEDRPDVAVDPSGEQEQDTGRALDMDVVRDHRPNDRLLDPDVPGEDRADTGLRDPDLAGDRGTEATELDRHPVAAGEPDAALRDRDVRRLGSSDPTLPEIDVRRDEVLDSALRHFERLARYRAR